MASTPISTSHMSIRAGKRYPLGAHWDGRGVNFALVAPNAHAVKLCLFDGDGKSEAAQLLMSRCEDGVWHCYIADAQPGLIYGYRVLGPHAPQQGQRFNHHKLLLDPYAREVIGSYQGQAEFCGYQQGNHDHADEIDNAAMALKAAVVHNGYDWGDDAPPDVPMAETILYEVHVKGFTALHPEVPTELRGSYAGLAHPAALDYLQKLGVTSLSILPVHGRADEMRLLHNGLSNYWGYSSIAFFAPEQRYWSGRTGTTPISEFRDMVKALHSRGLEVLLDVVYNHTAESDEFGPTISFRGIDNALYYRLRPDDAARYENWSGCGNCLDMSKPRVLQLVMDSLRYWVEEMHVDGFRFDLAPILGRGESHFSTSANFFAALRQDPVLSHVKLIAEPWDIGPDGYRLGQFPDGWLEWNDQFRDTMRAFWLHQWPTLGELARRFCGSNDIFHHSGRLPIASVNLITAHDGFTLRDLVSYNHKHNNANGEHNNDGHNNNHSWNCGVEGLTESPEVNALRARLQRALLATLFFSQGTPMLLGGDEIGHTQQGNNNAYCQDNQVTWLDWANADLQLSGYVQQLIALRKRYPALRHANWYRGAAHHDAPSDITWLSSQGGTMHEEEWDSNNSYRIGIRLNGMPEQNGTKGETCLILLNAEAQDIDFVLPGGTWRIVLDSAHPQTEERDISHTVRLPMRSVWLAIEAPLQTKLQGEYIL